MGFLPSRRDAGTARLRSIENARIRKAGNDLFHGIASAEVPDRHDSIVSIAGIDTSAFRRNPVLMLAHGGDLPIGRVVSLQRTEVAIARKAVSALGISFTFGSGPESQRVKSDVADRLVQSLSIAFIPLDERRATPEETKAHAFRNPDRATVITRSELIEISIVAVPSNPHAVIELPMGRGYSEGEIGQARIVARALRSVAPQQSRALDRAIREAERVNLTCASGGASAAFCGRARGRDAADLAAGLAALSRDTAALLRGGRSSDLDGVGAVLRDVQRDLARRGVSSPSSTRSDLDRASALLRSLKW